MKFKMESIKVNDVWILVDPSEEIKFIECKWIFKKKRGTEGKMKIYKVCLIVKGYHQYYGIDYDEIFFFYGNAQVHSDYTYDSDTSRL